MSDSMTSPRSPERFDGQRLRELALAATPGPWRWGHWLTTFGEREPAQLSKRVWLERHTSSSTDAVVRLSTDDCTGVLRVEEEDICQQDQEYIAAVSPDVVLALLAQRDALQREVIRYGSAAQEYGERLEAESAQHYKQRDRAEAAEAQRNALAAALRAVKDDCGDQWPKTPDDWSRTPDDLTPATCQLVDAALALVDAPEGT